MNSKEAFEKWAKENPLDRGTTWKQAQLDAWNAGAAYQRAQDLGHVEAVKTEMQHSSLPPTVACDEIAARITAEEPGKGEG